MNPTDFLDNLMGLFDSHEKRQKTRERHRDAALTRTLQNLYERPFVRWLRGDVTTVSGTNPVIRFFPVAPPAGMEWRVRIVSVTGVDPTTAVANAKVQTFRGDPGPTTLVDAGGAGTGGALVPNTAFYSVGQCTIKTTDSLVCGFSGAITNATRLFGLALVEQVSIQALPGEAVEEIEDPTVTKFVETTASA